MQNGSYFHYESSDNLPGIVSSHGTRTYLGIHNNGLYANIKNGGALPSPSEEWFHPARDLTIQGKLWFDHAILRAAEGCEVSCKTATMNPHVMYYQRR